MSDKRENILVSACIVGVCCRYNAKVSKSQLKQDKIVWIQEKYNLIPVCPEQLGGLETPRECSEIQNGDGKDLVNKKDGVLIFGSSGKDLTQSFLNGAKETLKILDLVNAKKMITQMRSPSCSCKIIYDGSFSGVLKNGIGITAAYLMKERNIELIDVNEINNLKI